MSDKDKRTGQEEGFLEAHRPEERTEGGLWRQFRHMLDLSPARLDAIRSDVEAGALPDIRYYILMAIASLVAALGLVTNSPAVIIGAMLISPLMTPMFGVSLGLVSGRMRMTWTGLSTLFSGVLIAVACGCLVGLLPLHFKVTPEMLARTQPTLLDLCVAVLAGTAGCLAMLDERISPILPGIAIATSLVPPLADSGLCFALEAPAGGMGAFLLFFANLLAIIVVSSLLFGLAGLSPRSSMGSGLQLTRRFSAVIASVAVVLAVLTGSLYRMVDSVRTHDTIEKVILQDIADRAETTLHNIIFKKLPMRTDVLVQIRTSKAFTPTQVKRLEDKVTQALATPATVIVRNEIAKDVCATGATSVVVDENLDGTFITDQLDPKVRRLQIADQTAREVLEGLPGIFLRDLDLIDIEGVPVVLASIEGTKPVLPEQVGRVEALLQKRMNDPTVRLVVRAQDLIGVTKKGRVLLGAAHLDLESAGGEAIQRKVEDGIRERIRALSELFPMNVDACREGEGWHARAQVTGVRMLKPAEAQRIEDEVGKEAGVKVHLDVWCMSELVVDGTGYYPREGYSETAGHAVSTGVLGAKKN